MGYDHPPPCRRKGLQKLLIAFSLKHLRLSNFNALEDDGEPS
jgi:hypothetical protein